jgi:polyisoprenoid-binding protein YceI
VDAASPPSPAAVAEPIAPTPEPTRAEAIGPVVEAASSEPVRWTVETGSRLAFTTSWGGEEIRGRFDRWTADIVFSGDALDRSKVRVSIDTGSASTGDPQRDGSLPTGDWFDTAAHPKAVFTATRFTKTGEGRFTAHGKLTLRGVSKPLDLPFRLKITGDRAEVSGVTSLDRTAFGVGQGEWASIDQIPAKVIVTVSLKARAAS